MTEPDYDNRLPDPGDDRVPIQCGTCGGSGVVRDWEGWEVLCDCGGSGEVLVSED
jgi:hypothetical protein